MKHVKFSVRSKLVYNERVKSSRRIENSDGIATPLLEPGESPLFDIAPSLRWFHRGSDIEFFTPNLAGKLPFNDPNFDFYKEVDILVDEIEKNLKRLLKDIYHISPVLTLIYYSP